jgi:hypothetical protein
VETVMTKRFWLAGLAGGLAMFVWMGFAHTTAPLATAGIQRIQNEPTVVAALQNALGPRQGMFIFPSRRPAEAEAAGQQPPAATPSGLLIYRPTSRGMEPRQLIAEFGLELLESYVAVGLLSAAVLAGFWRRVRFFAGLGVLAAVVTNGSYWIWYGFPAAYSLTAMLVEFVKFLLAGVAVALVFAAMRETRRATAGSRAIA